MFFFFVVGMPGDQVQVFVVASHNKYVSIDSFPAFSVRKVHILTLLSHELYMFVCRWAPTVRTTHANTTDGGSR